MPCCTLKGSARTPGSLPFLCPSTEPSVGLPDLCSGPCVCPRPPLSRTPSLARPQHFLCAPSTVLPVCGLILARSLAWASRRGPQGPLWPGPLSGLDRSWPAPGPHSFAPAVHGRPPGPGLTHRFFELGTWMGPGSGPS